MGGTAFFDQLQCLVKFGLRIMGQRQHDVAADILESGAPGGGKGCPRLLGAVGTAKGAQLGVPGRLHPEGNAVHPCARKPRRLSPVTVSGFASKVISAPGTGSAARMSRSACAGVSRLGVPPPK